MTTPSTQTATRPCLGCGTDVCTDCGTNHPALDTPHCPTCDACGSDELDPHLGVGGDEWHTRCTDCGHDDVYVWGTVHALEDIADCPTPNED